MSQDLWLQNYDASCRLAQEIAENLHERNRQQRTGGNPAKLNMTLRASLQKLKQNIAQLRETLIRAAAQRHIMQAEADRRQNLVDDLATREKMLNGSFKGNVTECETSRSTLMTGGNGAGPAVNPWLVNESEETRGLGFGEIRQQQQQIIEAQDAGLDALAAVISRQKHMGQEIGNELDEQNEIIDDLTQLVDKTDSRIRNETHRVKLVDTKSASCVSSCVLSSASSSCFPVGPVGLFFPVSLSVGLVPYPVHPYMVQSVLFPGAFCPSPGLPFPPIG
ncbi:syntaxin-8-like isoform X2 [Myxocyprinus asiaticus]|uniref:syntaxin-8-like isoform X2 n=1 Tax=Myxocyprinus asiaticus TaxID=70543 RepID=UPI002222702E|nr:syntaxin-8-like isoform X2 [Myxocyprinus asiaticus]